MLKYNRSIYTLVEQKNYVCFGTTDLYIIWYNRITMYASVKQIYIYSGITEELCMLPHDRTMYTFV